MNKVNFKPAKDIKALAEQIFEREKLRILASLPNADVQHIGATSIIGSISKGDLDINVRVPRKDFKKAIDFLKKFYQINQPQNWTKDFASFKDNGSFDLDLGVQLVVVGSKSDDFVKLRDLLASRPDLVKKYNEMKTKYEGKNMDDYRKEKAEFFENLRKLLT